MNLNTVSDKIVFSILKDIKVGHLELTNYDGKNYSFGNIEDTLKANIKIKNKWRFKLIIVSIIATFKLFAHEPGFLPTTVTPVIVDPSYPKSL